MVGKTMVYMVEVVNKVQSISLNYGTITRDSPVRLVLIGFITHMSQIVLFFPFGLKFILVIEYVMIQKFIGEV